MPGGTCLTFTQCSDIIKKPDDMYMYMYVHVCNIHVRVHVHCVYVHVNKTSIYCINGWIDR